MSVRIEKLVVSNFKSYRGEETIGPFRGFTAVIGPNGSGKSNVMDALSFVLGVETRKLRGSLHELVHAGESSPACHVTLHLTRGDASQVFRRSIVNLGRRPESRWSVDGFEMTAERYRSELATLGLDAKDQSFLVFQGDVESVVSASPAKLALFFEEESGSAAYRGPYEEAVRAKAEADARSETLNTRRRAAKAEHRALREAAAAAARAAAAASRLREASAQRLLAKAYAFETEAADAEARGTAAREALASRQEALTQAQETSEAARREQASRARRRLAHDRDARARSAALGAGVANAASERARRTEAKAQAAERALASAREAEAARARRVAALEEQLEQLEAAAGAAAEAEAEAASAAAGEGGVVLAPAQLARYRALRRELATRTSRDEADRAKLLSTDAAAADRRRAAAVTLASLEARLRDARDSRAAAEARVAALERAVSEGLARKRERSAAARQAAERRRQAGEARAAAMRELAEAEDAAREAGADEAARDRARSRAAVDAELSRALPGVLGALADLSDVPERRWLVAATVALGRDADALVTDDQDTAIAAIHRLHAKREPPRTFLPAASIRARGGGAPAPPDAAFRASLPAGARPAADCIVASDPRVARVLQALLQNTAFCDSTEIARRVAYGDGARVPAAADDDDDEAVARGGARRPPRARAVTVDGTLFSPSGLVTGGSSAGLEARAARWEAGAAGRAGQRVEACRRRAAEVPADRELEADQARAEAAEAEADNRARLDDVDLRVAREKLQDAERLREALEAELRRRATTERASEARDEVEAAARAGRVAALTARIDEAAEGVLGGLAAELGLGSAKELEAKLGPAGSGEAAATAAARHSRAAAVASRVRSQLDYERRGASGSAGGDGPGAVAKAEAACAAAREEARDAVRASRESTEKAREAAVEAARLSEESSQLRRQVDEAIEASRQARAAVTDAEAAVAAAEREASNCDEDRAQALAALEELVAQAEADGMPLPRGEAGQAEGGSAGEGGAEGEGPAPPALPLRPRQPPSLFDYTSLPTTARSPDPVARAQALARLEATESGARRAAEEAGLGGAGGVPVAPAPERADAAAAEAAARLHEAVAAHEEARAETARAATEVARIAALRRDAFMETFYRAAEALPDAYDALTRGADPSAPRGQASLAVDSEEAPWEGGVLLEATPPGARYQELSELSGGERAVAGLALLASLQASRASPLLVLDEVDAPLDATRVRALGAVLRNRADAVGRPATQVIVVSHKAELYSQADALVGVCADPDRGGASSVYTLDLGKFSGLGTSRAAAVGA